MASPTWDGAMAAAVAETDRWTDDEAVTRLFAAHTRQLVRLAALLLADAGTAEDVVQDAYVRLHQHWWRLRDPDRALGYLRTSVVNGARSALRHRAVARRYPEGLQPPPDVPSAESTLLANVGHASLLAALRRLPTLVSEQDGGAQVIDDHQFTVD
jgi:DNA-directed RNA polymerase specialized sigma24 family protein